MPGTRLDFVVRVSIGNEDLSLGVNRPRVIVDRQIRMLEASALISLNAAGPESQHAWCGDVEVVVVGTAREHPSRAVAVRAPPVPVVPRRLERAVVVEGVGADDGLEVLGESGLA